jgi:hypothetical protein
MDKNSHLWTSRATTNFLNKNAEQQIQPKLLLLSQNYFLNKFMLLVPTCCRYHNRICCGSLGSLCACISNIWGVFKKRSNFLNSAPTSTESALWILSAPSVRFWQQNAICPILLWALVVELHLLNWACAQAVRQISDKEEIQENALRDLHTITESVF